MAHLVSDFGLYNLLDPDASQDGAGLTGSLQALLTARGPTISHSEDTDDSRYEQAASIDSIMERGGRYTQKAGDMLLLARDFEDAMKTDFPLLCGSS